MEWQKKDKIPMLVVCGPTASGKTKVGAELARQLNGEVISADSMQIYKGLEIATAAPTEEEMLGVPHHLIRFLEAGEPFSVADYVSAARKKADEIIARGKLPVVVGGAGLYINSLIDNISFEGSETDGSIRRRLTEEAEQNGNAYMLEKLRKVDPTAAERLHENNIVRVIRALELYEVTGRTFDENMKLSRSIGSPYEVCMIGLNFENRQDLYDRINLRVGIMADSGMVEEAEKVYRSGDIETAGQAIGFKELIPYFEGRDTKEHCLDNIRQVSRHYAKRQLTWFRRDARINWINQVKNEQFDKIIGKCLNIVAKSEIMCYNKK